MCVLVNLLIYLLPYKQVNSQDQQLLCKTYNVSSGLSSSASSFTAVAGAVVEQVLFVAMAEEPCFLHDAAFVSLSAELSELTAEFWCSTAAAVDETESETNEQFPSLDSTCSTLSVADLLSDVVGVTSAEDVTSSMWATCGVSSATEMTQIVMAS